MDRRGQKFRTHGGHQGVVLADQGAKLFVKFFDGDRGTISAGDVVEFYGNTGRGRAARARGRQPVKQGSVQSERSCRNCGNKEPHIVGGGHRCTMCDTEYLEGFSGWFYTEMAMQSGKGLAAVQEGGLMVVFNPTARLKKAVQAQDDTLWEGGEVDVMGILEMRENSLYQSSEVERIWARPGYGPMLYMIGMSTDPERGLMPTRVQQHISEPAKNIWQQFASGKGQQFVTPHDAPDEQGQLPAHHPEPFLNKRYTINQPHPEFSNMLMKGEQFFSNDRYGEHKTHFIEFADAYLKQQMDQIYDFDD